ncbi:MAG: alpha-amylase family glycosyl hydrolase [Melioribacteraceae bacterium]
MTLTKIVLGNENLFIDRSFPKYEFHISKEVRNKYNFDDGLFEINGNVILADFNAVRIFVQKINSKREVKEHVVAGQVNAAGLMDEIYHYLFRLYELQINPGVFKKALDHLNSKLGEERIRKILFDFVSVFPPIEVYKGKSSAYDYLNSYSADRSNAEVTLEELILLYIANYNPANKKLIELFDQKHFSEKELYKKTVDELDLFFQNEKKLGPDNQDVFTFLKTPIINHPDNIEAQLDFIREKYGILLDDKFLKRILTGKDLIKEDYKLEFGRPGGAPTVVPQYKSGMYDDSISLGKSGYKYVADSYKDYEEFENFTPDSNWMPRVVMIAKNIYVWLDQLSKKYQRHIKTLDQIPDEELDQLANWNFNGLWLIGIWERSSASKKIKHIMGNIDAVSSAYSLYDYQIANDLGGELSYNNLNERARARGIRLASDMVPNHTGIFSKWVIEHPEYFIQSNHPPFPNYSFTGNNLSDDHSVQIRIEDGFWRRSDAAVVFQRIDNNSREVRYIYHGNDGTNMPWNDTAQLNMIRQEVREAVMQKIFDVARKFSIIRFDAAMTLAKKHFSRLWYPEPGRGGDIPSRADYAMTREEFDKVFPVEFWREVVDRINNEMPDTLLLAEAFWLMEGYFVRTLGMHRVYNSAFMHMMMKEENAKYRDLISNTLEFEPEILKRYVNFMSNPDEETAIKQFGTDDKYFGVCMLMVTLPGLPMLAHGQIEGYTEKYGMEYQRAYYNETPNQWLIDRHQYEIFPLMKKRYLFSQVSNFWLFDFIDGFGGINENVFAYTNTEHGERALIFYNNKYENTSGTIFRSSAKLMNNYGSRGIETRTIAEALWIKPSEKHFYIFRDHISNLEFIKTGIDIAVNGFYAELGAFKYLVYLDWREVFDAAGDWGKLAWKLGNNGVPNMQRAFDEMKVEDIHTAFEKMFDDESLDGFIKTCILEKTNETEKDRISFVDERYFNLLNTIKDHFGFDSDLKPIIEKFEDSIVAVRKLNFLLDDVYEVEKKSASKIIHHAIQISRDTNYHDNSIIFMLWLIISNMKDLFPLEGKVNWQNYVTEMLLDTPVRKILQKSGKGETEIFNEINLLDIFLNNFDEMMRIFSNAENDKSKIDSADEPISARKGGLISFLDNEAVRMYIDVNQFENIWYYSKEKFEELFNWILTFYGLEIMKNESYNSGIIANIFDQSFRKYLEIIEISNKSEYKLDKFKEKLKSG